MITKRIHEHIGHCTTILADKILFYIKYELDFIDLKNKNTTNLIDTVNVHTNTSFIQNN